MVFGYHHLADVKAVLVIKKKWSDMIRTGSKTMELRSSSLRKYQGEWVGFAVSGCHAIWGAGRISESTLLDEQELFTPRLISQHRVEPKDLARIRAALAAKGAKSMSWKRIYGIRLRDLTIFPQPVPYHHPRGAIGVVRLISNKVFQHAMVDIRDRSIPRKARPRWRVGVLRPVVQPAHEARPPLKQNA